MVEFHFSGDLQGRLQHLLDKNRQNTLTPEENTELDEMELLDPLITMLKGRIYEKGTPS